MAPHFFRFIIAGWVASAWAKFGGLGASLVTFAHILQLGVAETMETTSKYEEARNAA